MSNKLPKPTNSLVNPLLTDLYQLTMVCSYWMSGRENQEATFELFFRKNPFKGEYTIFCGMDEVLKFMSNFEFSKSDLEYLQSLPVFADCDVKFFQDYLANLDCSKVKLYAMEEGTVAFPKVPVMTIVGPLGICQLLETTLLNLVNYPSLIATNANRMINAATKMNKKKAIMVELGLRRSQGPDGGFTASKYSVLGGFHGSSNVLAGKLLDLPIFGSMAHAFIMGYRSLDEVIDTRLGPKGSSSEEKKKLLPLVLKYRELLDSDNDDDILWSSTNDGELASFIAYASCFPDNFLCLVDTYDTLKSGTLNFILVSLVLDDLGYKAKGIRLDSGDLSYFSNEASSLFSTMGKKMNKPFFSSLDIIASNDLNESALHELNREGHSITIFGVGTNLVTCQEQPALGCVYKLVELNGIPRIKLSDEIEKVLIPGRKKPYRLFGMTGSPLIDVLLHKDEKSPEKGQRILCRHPFAEHKRVAVIPTEVKPLHILVFDCENGVVHETPKLMDSRSYVLDQIKTIRPDILRHIDPGQYKVSVSESVFSELHQTWLAENPVLEIR